MGRTPDTELNLADQETAGADAVTNTRNGAVTYSRFFGFNGSTWDRIRTGLSAVASSVVGYLNTLPFGKYNATAPTLTDGQFVVDQVDVNGNKKVTQATLLAGEDLTNDVVKVEQRFTYAYISTATTTQVKTGAGFLHKIIVNTTAAGTIKIIDDVSGSTVNIGQMKASIAEGDYEYNLSFTTGLRIITAATSDITVVYR
jgi:hypothetical protein